MDSVEEDLASIESTKNKDCIVNTYITSIKNNYDIFNKVQEPSTKSVSNIPNEINQLEKITKPAKLIIDQYNFDLSVFVWISSKFSKYCTI